MQVQELIAEVQGLVNSQVLAGMTWLQAVQRAVDELYALPTKYFLREGAAVTTVAGKRLYTYEELLGGETAARVRTLRGLWQPSLLGATSDYGRPPILDVDQGNVDSRCYEDSSIAIVDDTSRTVEFIADPGDTTTKWKADWYLRARRLVKTDEVPVLSGWETRLMVPGVHAFWELSREKKFGQQRAVFLEELPKYKDALEADYRVRRNGAQGVRREEFVRAQ